MPKLQPVTVRIASASWIDAPGFFTGALSAMFRTEKQSLSVRALRAFTADRLSVAHCKRVIAGDYVTKEEPSAEGYGNTLVLTVPKPS